MISRLTPHLPEIWRIESAASAGIGTFLSGGCRGLRRAGPSASLDEATESTTKPCRAMVYVEQRPLDRSLRPSGGCVDGDTYLCYPAPVVNEGT